MSDFADLLRTRLEGVVEIGSEQVDALQRHYDHLARWNRRMNLTAIRSIHEIVERHYCESVFLAAAMPQSLQSVGDLGSGPGFPGVPIAVLHSGAAVSLIESNARKCVFLRESTRHLSNVSVLEARSNQLAGPFEWIVSRAVRWRDVADAAYQCAKHVAVLVGESDVRSSPTRFPYFTWEEPRRVPWGDRRFLVIGHVSRETQTTLSFT